MFAIEQTNAPTADVATPTMRSRHLPNRSAKIPEGNSVKSLEMNHDEDTSPTRNSDGLSCRAKIGRKADGRLMLMTSAKAAITRSKYGLGYDLSPMKPSNQVQIRAPTYSIDEFLIRTEKQGNMVYAVKKADCQF